jgi:hypothetical protein
VNATEIVKRKMQSNRSFQIVELLRERIGETCKPSHLHSHGQILSLYHATYNLLSRIRAEANREAMAILADRETANARHFQQLCLESDRATR